MSTTATTNIPQRAGEVFMGPTLFSKASWPYHVTTLFDSHIKNCGECKADFLSTGRNIKAVIDAAKKTTDLSIGLGLSKKNLPEAIECLPCVDNEIPTTLRLTVEKVASHIIKDFAENWDNEETLREVTCTLDEVARLSRSNAANTSSRT